MRIKIAILLAVSVLVIAFQDCGASFKASNMVRAVTNASFASSANLFSGKFNSAIVRSTGLMINAFYPDCAQAAVQADVYLLVNGSLKIENRCYINSSSSQEAPNTAYCSVRSPIASGTFLQGGFVRIWKISSDCATYSDQLGREDAYDDFQLTGSVQEDDAYTNDHQARMITVDKPAYRIRIDPNGGATYELYSKVASEYPSPLNSIHANGGAALQIDLQSQAMQSLTSKPCGGQGNFNPTQAGSACSFLNGVSGSGLSPLPGDSSSQLTVSCDGVVNNNCKTATSNISHSLHRMMSWDYGPGDEGPYNPHDLVFMSQTAEFSDDFIEFSLQIINKDVTTRTGAIELPTYYFHNGFRQVDWTDANGISHSQTIPVNQSGMEANAFHQILGTDEPRWVTFTNNGVLGNDTFTISWMYDSNFADSIGAWSASGWGVSETDVYHQIKFNNARAVNLKPQVSYGAKYVIFPRRATDLINSRFGTFTVAQTIEKLRTEYSNLTATAANPPTLSSNTPAVNSTLIPIYRFLSADRKTHFFTASYAEGISAGMTLESRAFQLFNTSSASNSPLYRCFGTSNFLSNDSACEGAHTVGLIGYVGTNSSSGSVLMYRLYQTSTGDHLSTLVSSEGISSGYVFEGGMGYVMP